MNDDELRSAYGALRREREQRSAAERPTTESIRQALDGELSSHERERVLEQAITSGASIDLALLQAVQLASGDAAPSSTSRAATTHGRSRFASGTRRWWTYAAAAALVLAVGVPIATRAPNDTATNERPPFRDATRSTTPQLLAPAEGTALHANERFVWGAVPGGASYALELIDASGKLVSTVVTMDTSAVLDSSVTEQDRARTSGWWITVTFADGRRTRSALRLTDVR